MQLTWFERAGRPCLRIEGAVAGEPLASFSSSEEIAPRVAILPSALLGERNGSRTLQPISGTFELDAGALYFTPRFPFVAGTSYAVLVDDRDVTTIERPAADRAPVTRAIAIYPSAPVVPVNLLRLYVHFSAPMSEGWALRSVYACRADGEPLRDVFLHMSPELWDPEHRRLTLLLDPGRIKRGLVPNLEAGYPLVEGEAFSITVNAGFRDADGRPLIDSVTQHYDVGLPVRTRVDPSRWHYQYPSTGSAEPLVVTFDRPLDRALLDHSLGVLDGSGAVVRGRVEIAPGERTWQFEPDAPWRPGPYRLAIDARLEDTAGNSLTRVFDRDLSRPEDNPAPVSTAEVFFFCRPTTRAASAERSTRFEAS